MIEEHSNNGRSHAVHEAWSKNWRVPLLLLLLRHWSSYGYDLLEQLSACGFAALNPGTCYRTLRQMERAGMVCSRWDLAGGGPARRVYSITDAGEAYLHRWAQSLEQSQRLMQTFFRLDTGQAASREEEAAEALATAAGGQDPAGG